MSDELEARFLEDWLHQTEVTPPDPREGARRVAARLPQTRQLRRWLPFPVSDRKAPVANVADTAEYQLGPIPGTNGHAPTIIGRTQTMLSPAKAVIAGALVFAVGSLFLVVQRPAQPDAVVPAQMAERSVAGATVMQDCLDIFATPIVCDWTSSDPRLTGTLTHEWTANISPPEPDDFVSLGWAPATLETPDGDWTGHLYALWGTEQLFVVLSGDGAYDGWRYVASTLDNGVEVGDSEWTGVIYEGELPPFGPPAPSPGG